MRTDRLFRAKRRTTSLGMYKEMLVRYVLPHKKMLASLAVLLVLSIGLQLINPQIIRYFIDTAQGEGSLTALYYAAGFFIGFHSCSRAYRLQPLISARIWAGRPPTSCVPSWRSTACRWT